MRQIIFLFLLGCLCKAQEDDVFPEYFRFGVATASYQIEGGWDADGKGENIWDHLTHNRASLIDDGSNGDVACDSYNKIDDDITILKELGVKCYRFSISWSRILPTGYVNNINEAGINYYKELIEKLDANEIEPVVTMYHWDLPQPLHEIGGWTSPLIVDLFVDYADVLFREFGDQVKEWITFNEPFQICQQGYGDGFKAPAYTQDGIGGYLCGHHLLLAHANTYKLYNDFYRSAQDGFVGITVNGNWADPANEDSVEDVAAAETYIQFNFGWFLHPIYAEDYPDVMRQQIDDRSTLEEFTDTRLPKFTEEEIELIHGSSDFLGLNHYTSFKCEPLDITDLDTPSFKVDSGVNCYQEEDWESGASSWLKVRPEGLYNMLDWIKTEYGNPEVMITENGFSEAGDVTDLNDCNRVNYYNSYLESVLRAINDECKVTAYMAWSLMDNFEWMRGYTERFGLYHVDFEDDERPRTPKKSALVYANIIETRKIDTSFDPEGFESCPGAGED